MSAEQVTVVKRGIEITLETYELASTAFKDAQTNLVNAQTYLNSAQSRFESCLRADPKIELNPKSYNEAKGLYLNAAALELEKRENALKGREIALKEAREAFDKASESLRILQQVQQTDAEKRTRDDKWFPENISSKEVKKSKTDQNDDQSEKLTIKCLEMNGSPPMAQSSIYTTLVVRSSYVVIFDEVYKNIKELLDDGSPASVVVTGNPGTGKSRLYLYFVFRFIRNKTSDSFPLIINFRDDFQQYDREKKEFVQLSNDEVSTIKKRREVVRLIEADTTGIDGWSGISILFTSPGHSGLNQFKKVKPSYTFILPVWTFDELHNYNSILEDKLKLSDEILTKKYNIYGGIPRYIFNKEDREEMKDVDVAIKSFNALDIISFVKETVRENHCSHRVLCMVPDASDYRADFHLDFLSKHIAERVIEKVEGDSLQKLSEFAIAHANDDSGSTAVLIGRIYELLCHKWFKRVNEFEICFRSLNDKLCGEMITTKQMNIESFYRLEDIANIPLDCSTYYRPKSQNFGALDAFILDTIAMKCYGLQMTMNINHGIKAQPMRYFLNWLTELEKQDYELKFEFFLVFVVPSSIEGQYKEQTIRNKSGDEHQNAGDLAKINQCVAALDVFYEKSRT